MITQNKPGETLSILLNFTSLVALAVDIILKIDQREDVTPTTLQLDMFSLSSIYMYAEGESGNLLEERGLLYFVENSAKNLI